MGIYDVLDLNVYQKSLSLLPQINTLVRKIPESHRKLRVQLINASESIPAQISEGFAKRSSLKEFKRYLYIALGSSDETISHLRTVYLLAKDCPIDKNLCEKLGFEYKVVSKQINTLIHKWIDYEYKKN